LKIYGEKMNLIEMGRKARTAARTLAQTETSQKNKALLEIAKIVWEQRDLILAANQRDIQLASGSGISAALIERLTLNESRLTRMVSDLKNVASLPDPVGEIIEEEMLSNDLYVLKQRVPIGVLGVIYESRPNVTLDVASLALKSGNAAILRGGSETIHTNRALVNIIALSLSSTNLPPDAIQFIDDPDRAYILQLLKLYEYVDMIIPRGGAVLHTFCRENSRIPVITGGIGICHLFVDETADLKAALPVIRNAKIQRPTVCNALDTVLIHKRIAGDFIPQMVHLLSTDGVSFRTDPIAHRILSDLASENIQLAGPNDFDTEWLSLVLGIKVVDDLEEAIAHIALHSTGHSDGIMTGTDAHARRFVSEVDSAVVYVNASTRFTDGSQLGLGAEVAISTQRLHARGPMGLRELTTYKWVVYGNYHIRP
jgi:glutamate-5-semialdehyde dehydrogenase